MTTMDATGRPIRVSVVTCYFDPDYARGTVIHRALAAVPEFETRWVRSRARGVWRFGQIIGALLRERLFHPPDVWVLTFRGQEVLPLVLAIAGRTPVVFDEFIVPIAYATQEPHTASPAIRLKHASARIAQPAYRRWLRRCGLILADTPLHARLSAELNRVPEALYRVLPVGADERLFHPGEPVEDSEGFSVLYYGNMLPLHGVQTVLDAAVLLRDDPRIRMRIIGGGDDTAALVEDAVARGARVEHTAWIPLAELPRAVHSSQLCLGGPFGGTPQATRVVTGKTYQFLACGVPTLVGRNEAEPLLVDHDTCLVVDQHDPSALSAAIRWAADHPAELGAIGDRGRALYEREFGLASQSARLSGWIAELLERGPLNTPSPPAPPRDPRG
ncbi:MAG: glycosyltransferase [Protaetiibacter sp.]